MLPRLTSSQVIHSPLFRNSIVVPSRNAYRVLKDPNLAKEEKGKPRDLAKYLLGGAVGLVMFYAAATWFHESYAGPWQQELSEEEQKKKEEKQALDREQYLKYKEAKRKKREMITESGQGTIPGEKDDRDKKMALLKDQIFAPPIPLPDDKKNLGTTGERPPSAKQ